MKQDCFRFMEMDSASTYMLILSQVVIKSANTNPGTHLGFGIGIAGQHPRLSRGRPGFESRMPRWFRNAWTLPSIHFAFYQMPRWFRNAWMGWHSCELYYSGCSSC